MPLGRGQEAAEGYEGASGDHRGFERYDKGVFVGTRPSGNPKSHWHTVAASAKLKANPKQAGPLGRPVLLGQAAGPARRLGWPGAQRTIQFWIWENLKFGRPLFRAQNRRFWARD